MDRPDIEELFGLAKDATGRPWKFEPSNYYHGPEYGNMVCDYGLNHPITPVYDRKNAEFMVFLANNSESIAQYAIEKEKEAALYKKAFEIFFELISDSTCPPEAVQHCLEGEHFFECPKCRRDYALSEARRQMEVQNERDS